MLSASRFDNKIAWYENLIDPPECFLILGPGPGSSPFLGASRLFATQIGVGIEASYPALPPKLLGGQLAVQILLWNPAVFPGQPEQCSAGLLMQVLPGGMVVATPYGSTQGGLEVWAEVTQDAGLPPPRTRSCPILERTVATASPATGSEGGR